MQPDFTLLKVHPNPEDDAPPVQGSMRNEVAGSGPAGVPAEFDRNGHPPADELPDALFLLVVIHVQDLHGPQEVVGEGTKGIPHFVGGVTHPHLVKEGATLLTADPHPGEKSGGGVDGCT